MVEQTTRFDRPVLSDGGVERPVNVTLVDYLQSQDPNAAAGDVASAWCRCQGYEKAVHYEWSKESGWPKGAWRLVRIKAGEAVWRLCSYCGWHFTRIDCAGPGHTGTAVSFDHQAQETPPDH